MAHQGRRIFGHLLFNPRIGLSWVVFTVVALASAWGLIETNHPPLTTAPVVRASEKVAAPQSATKASRKKSARTPKKAAAPVAAARQPIADEWVARTNRDITYYALRNGYIAWSLCWGIPACISLLLSLIRQSMSSASSMLASGILYVVGALPALAVAGLFMVGGVFYSILGGGVVHFLMHWYGVSRRPIAAAVQPVPALAPPSEPMLHVHPEPEDPQQRLKTVADLYQSGLITAEDYDEAKRKILDEITTGKPAATRISGPPAP